MPINFPSSPSNNQLFVTEGKAMRYNATKNRWKAVSTLSSSQITDLENRTVGVSSMSISGNTLVIQKDDSSYANVSLASFAGNKLTTYANASILPLSDLVSGTQVYVEDTDSLYITDGSGWYKIATVNLSPSLTLGVSSISLGAGGSIDVNYTVNEPEDTPYTVSASSTSNATITVHQSNNTITFDTPVAATTETITITATDGVNSVGDTLTMTISLGPDWSTTSQQAKIQLSSITATDLFGYDVGLSDDGNTAVITAVREDTDGADSGAAYVYTKSPTYYDLSSASYASKSYTFTAVENSPTGFAFNSDGTKLIIVGWQQIIGGSGTGGCYQYSLSTAYDVSTATYDSVSFNLGNEMVQPMGIKFSSDGTRMFVIDNQAPTNGDVVFQYNLSTGFDISTASYSNNSLNVNPYENILGAIDFKPDGTKMFLIGAGSDTVRAWDLSSAWDLSTASYASETFSASSQEGSCTGLTFNGSGTKMYINGYATDNVYQYSLSTAWDVSSASYDSVSFNFSTQEGQPRQIRFNSDGSKLWMIGTDTDSIYQYNTTTFWEQQQQIQGSDTGGNDLYGYRCAISGDGLTIVIGNNNPDDAEAYVFTFSGGTWSQQTKISTGQAGAHRMALDYNGNTLVVGQGIGQGGNAKIYTRSGSTWSSATALSNSGNKVAISKDGNTIALGKENTNTVYIYVYASSTWSLQATLSPSTFSLDLGSGAKWGSSVGLSENGNDLVIGAYGRLSTQGEVYVCTRSGSTWSLQTSSGLTASDGAGSAEFGYSADMSNDGNTILIGAKAAGTGGKIYIFTRDGSTWSEQFDGTSSDIESGDNFSFNVAIAGNDGTVIAGAPNEDTGATNAGAAYVFTAS